MKQSVHIVVAVLIAVGIGASTTACSAISAPSPSSPGTEPSSSPSATAQDVDRVGQVISADRAASLPDGQKGYQMADGSYVVVQTDKPLPAAVVAEVQATTAAKQAAASSEVAKSVAADSAASKLSFDTGKEIIPVTSMYGSMTFDGSDTVLWGSAGTGLKPQTTRAGQEAAVAAWIASQPDAANYEMVVFPNGR